ncbi:S-layer homology domain-containing protein [Paenibacillus filicis]|uniref:S-layer homology domain-containing protein n=1 Tax=Paenibacillus filicis TaxID=669464 RepID=A0ABU9DWK8_9BACL
MIRLTKQISILTACWALLLGFWAMPAEAQSQFFRDVPGHWAEQAVYKMVQQGLLDGFPDGTFRPDDPVTADQFVKILLLSFSQLHPNGERSWTAAFIDSLSPANQSLIRQDYRNFSFQPSLVGYWAKPYMDLAGDLQFIDKSQFSDYKAKLKREDVAEMIYYTLKETEYLEDEMSSLATARRFGDFQSVPARKQKFIGEVMTKGIMEGYPNGYFGVGREVTRAEALLILDRLQNKAARISVPAAGQPYVKVVPTKDGSYKKLVFPDEKMLQAYGLMEAAGKLRGTNYDLEETVLRMYKDADAKALALKSTTEAGKNGNEASLWLEPQFQAYGVTVRLEEGVLARNLESIRKFTDFVFGYDADTFCRLFTASYAKALKGEAVVQETVQIGRFSVEVRLQADGKALVFSVTG